MMSYMVCMEDGEIVKKTRDGFESTEMYVLQTDFGIDWTTLTVGETFTAEADA
jgi:hypothetical protein